MKGVVLIDYYLGEKWAAVAVERCGDSRRHIYRVIPDSVCMVGARTRVFDVPENYEIVGTDGKKIKPTGRFLLSADTIEPYHLLIDKF